tara:strand:- start:253931 stop:254851 length:921 start_codon:yes stop_codon:yes gene_type:complete
VKKDISSKYYIIPEYLNRVLFVIIFIFNLVLLYQASHTENKLIIILCAFFFAYTNNTMFALLHEAVHNVFSKNSKINRIFGIMASAFFPTGFSLQQVFHLSHHRFNRTEKERFDYIQKGENKFIKFSQWYCILTGVYWLFATCGAFFYLIIPSVFRNQLFKGRLGNQTGAESMFRGLNSANSLVLRLEILYSFSFQFCIFYLLDLNLIGYLACYFAFALNWSSLQYADHAFSELDTKDGAWNLKVSKFSQYLFLNYHFHKVHHQDMHIPWIHLSKLVDKNEERPSFWAIYLKMWRGPQPLPKESHV